MLSKACSKELMIERTHPEALVVAEHIITLAKAGVREPARLRYLAVEAIHSRRAPPVNRTSMGIGPVLAAVADGRAPTRVLCRKPQH